MPNRIPLLTGRTTPLPVKQTLSSFGRNPYGEPLYRLIWSERKQIFFAGETIPEYRHIDPPAWVLETWLDPFADAGHESEWGSMQQALMGPYPRHGTYNYVQQFPVADEESLRLYCVGLEKSKALQMKQRIDDAKEALEKKETVAAAKVAEEIVELSSDSGTLGKSQRSAFGAKNTFRTHDDFERDQWKVPDIPNMPQRGGKLVN